MSELKLHPRYARIRLEEALLDTPVVLVHGPRQCGKSTLARLVGDAAGYTYITFDDDVQLAAAQSDPVGFVADLPDKVVLDEVQRVPRLFLALKSVIDRQRTPGRFILTGSANVLLAPQIADSLAGRMEILRLHPLSQCEIAGTPPHFLDTLFAQGFTNRRYGRLGDELAERIVFGGYPAALARSSGRRRMTWYRDYIESLVQRDVRDLARIRSLDVLPRLLQLAAGQTAHLMNIAELAGPFQLTRPTISEYVTLLERVFLLEYLPSWHTNLLKRLVKSSKLHMGDTGVAAALLGLDSAALLKNRKLLGQLLETFVLQELRRQASGHESDFTFHHFRDKDGVEVDIVLERDVYQVAGVEVKAAATVTEADFRGLRKLQAANGDRFMAGVVLYDGENSVGFGPGLFAVPIRALWEAAD